jgi:hypothetical protein
MADSSQSQSPFWSGLMSGLNDMPSNPLFNMGLGLMDAARPFGNVGESLMKANQATLANQTARQNLGMNQLQMQMLKAKLPGMQAYFQGLSGLLSNPQGGAAPPQASPQGPMTAPAAPPSIALPSAAPPMGQPASAPQSGVDPMQALNLGTLGAAYGMPGAEQLAKYPENVTSVQKAVQTQHQMQTQGPMAQFDTIATAPNADKIIASSPQLMGHYAQIAPQLGQDPTRAPGQEEAQNYARYVYNQLAGQSGLPTKPMPVQLKTIQGPNGQVLQQSPDTGAITEPVKQEELKQVIGPDGKPVLLPASKAAGMQPFNATMFGAGNVTDQTKELMYQNWKATGQLPQGYARNPVMLADLTNFISQRAQADGVPGAAAAATHQQYQAQQGVLNDFTKGKSAQSLNGINTAVAHMDLLPPLIDALKGGNMTVLNKAQNFFKQQTGNSAPTNFSAIKEFVGGEVAKAVLPGGGGEAERQALTKPLDAANSPVQLKDAVSTIQKALAGKTEALRSQWDIGTNGTQGAFDRFLLPATKNALGIKDQSAHPPDVQALLNKYQ